MAGITSMGVGSGIDIKSLVQQLVTAEGQPTSNRLDTQEATYQAQLSAIGTFKGALSTFQSSLANLTSLSSFQKYIAGTSDNTSVTATATGSGASGNYQVSVTQLAKAQSLRTHNAFTSLTDSVGTGTLTFQYGDPTKPTRTVTINPGQDSLQGVRDAVNAANIGVSASIVKGGTNQYYLVFTSNQTGTDNAVTVSATESGTPGLSALNQANWDTVVTAQNALANINGIDVTSATNTISGVVDGMTFNLLKEGGSAIISVSRDKSSITAGVQGFVKAYNTLINNVQSISGYDAKQKKGGILIGDSMVRGIMNQLRQVIGSLASGVDSGYRALADVGIKTQADGTLAIDSAKFSSALDTNFDQVARLFAAGGTSTDSLVQYSDSSDATKAGNYDVNVTRLATQGSYLDTASSVSSLTVDSTNDTFSVKVDGIQSGTIALTRKTYADGQSLANELQSRINGDSTLQASGVSVTVAYDNVNGRFTFTSNRYGSASNVAITSVESTSASGNIGLTVSGVAGTAGQDVAGEIGGVAGSGSGQYLTGSGPASGLKLLIQGSATGDRGTVTFSRGIADQLDTLLTTLLGSKSPIDSRTNSINKSIDDITSQRDALSRRLDSLTARYTAQFTAMDTLVAQLNSTSSYLTQQFNALSNLTKSSK